MKIHINRQLAAFVLTIVDAGLVSGLGTPEPGKMCFEAAVCYAMGLPHGDKPPCVAPSLRDLNISLNDARWSSNMARARGLRRLAIAQLGSANTLDEIEFAKRVTKLAIQTMVPTALRAAASLKKDSSHRQALLDAANRCEIEGTRAAAYAAAYAAEAAEAAASRTPMLKLARAAYAAAVFAEAAAAQRKFIKFDFKSIAAYMDDKTLSAFAEGVVQILIDMGAHGTTFLDLAPLN